MEIDNERFNVQDGDVVLIPDGAFHRVHNGSKSNTLYFVCVFDGKRND
jgi:mannose-6-phosphate isomerase-like protein (cupin superfamily)